MTSAPASEVVVYEADRIDEDTHTGWSVMVTGPASRVTDPRTLSRYHAELTPWVSRETEYVVRIEAELVTGYRLERARTRHGVGDCALCVHDGPRQGERAKGSVP